MKLDLEALAREAGISILWGTDDNCQAKQYYEGWPEQVEAFARLIVERCAVECDKVSLQAVTAWKLAYQPQDQGREMGADDCASTIRQLLEDK